MNIGFRVEGGALIGMGHVMRCLSLAKALKRNGNKVIFITNDQTGKSFIVKKGFNVLSTSCSVLDFPEINEIILNERLDCIIVDTYQVDFNYFLSIKENVKVLCYIDDLNKFVYPVDILINGNFLAESMEYQKYDQDELLLLGTDYNLIRDEFKNLPLKTVKPEIEKILITTGGSDPVNLTGKLIEEIKKSEKLKGLKLDVAVGNLFSNQKDLYSLCKKYQGITLHENVKKMSKLMLEADLAITAGGSTLYELCSCGIPALAFIFASNQEFIVAKMSEMGYIGNLGWYENIDYGKLSEEVSKYEFEERILIADRNRGLVDGKGAERVSIAIGEYILKNH